MEVLHEAILANNLPLTVLLGLVVLYWAIVILGVIDFDHFDLHLDADADVDVDVEIDADADVHGGSGSGSAVHSFLKFIHVGDCPVMAILSVLILSMWTISMFMNGYLNPGRSMVLSLVYIIPNFVASVVLTRFFTTPLQRFFNALQHEEPRQKSILGEICQITTSQADHRSGQAEITTKGSPILINVRTGSEGEALAKGEDAVVVRQAEDFYIIKKLEV